jgi:hypothetical protein
LAPLIAEPTVNVVPVNRDDARLHPPDHLAGRPLIAPAANLESRHQARRVEPEPALPGLFLPTRLINIVRPLLPDILPRRLDRAG